MRLKIINFLKRNKILTQFIWGMFRFFMKIGVFILPQKKKIAFMSYGGRNYNDSPKALYKAICSDSTFDEYELVWFFVNPENFDIPRGRKIKVDTISYFLEIMTASIWISNSGMDRGIGLKTKKILDVNTFHGSPIKKMGEDIKTNLGFKFRSSNKSDVFSIRCAQSTHDLKIFKELFHADDKNFLLCDLPRNDALLQYTDEKISSIKHTLGISSDKKVILYTPTFRDYAWNGVMENYISPPISLEKWENLLSDKYVLLIRAHYAITAALKIRNSVFCIDVSNYPDINDLYIISDIMISDYSSTFVDYSILNRPMFCFAYDLDEYKTKRGIYDEIFNELPCRIDENEDSLLQSILECNYDECSQRTRIFHMKYSPFAGHATEAVICSIKNLLCLKESR